MLAVIASSGRILRAGGPELLRIRLHFAGQAWASVPIRNSSKIKILSAEH